MAITRFLVKFANSAVQANNYQLVDFDFGSLNTSTNAENAAAILGYFAQAGTCAGGTTIESISIRPPAAPGYTALPYPAAAYTAANGAAVTDGFTSQPGTGAWPFALGSGALCPLGTSISVTEFTTFAGPQGRGRHFLPFISSAVVAAGGTLSTLYQTAIRNAYNEFLFGVDPTGFAATAPNQNMDVVVTNALATSEHQIITITPQPVFSNLESRRR